MAGEARNAGFVGELALSGMVDRLVDADESAG